MDFDEEGKLRIKGVVHYRGRPTNRKTVPTIYGEVPANDVALIIIEDLLGLGDYSEGDYSDLIDLPEEESYPED